VSPRPSCSSRRHNLASMLPLGTGSSRRTRRHLSYCCGDPGCSGSVTSSRLYRPDRVPVAIWSLLRSLLFRGAVKRLDTPRNG
jgi:hypothetical protein